MSDWYSKWRQDNPKRKLKYLNLPAGEWVEVTFVQDVPKYLEDVENQPHVIDVRYKGKRYTWWITAESLREELRGVEREVGGFRGVTVKVRKPTCEGDDWSYQVEVVRE